MLIGRHPSDSDYIVGKKFLTHDWGDQLFDGYGSSARRIDLLHEITAVSGSTFQTRDHKGGLHQGRLRYAQLPEFSKCSRRMDRVIAWFDPLPNAPFEEIALFADALLACTWRNAPLLLHCESITESGDAICRLIHTTEQGGKTDYRLEEAVISGQEIGNAYVLDERVTLVAGADQEIKGWNKNRPRYSPVPGDFFLATKFQATTDTPPVITQAYLLKIRSGMTIEEVGAWMPEKATRKGDFSMTTIHTGGRGDIQIEIERAMARSEPDEIVVIAYLDTSDKVELTALSNSGIKLHEADCLNDDLYGLALEIGVWIGVDIHWYNCGDDGAEWEASWRRATVEDLERHGLSLEEVAATWEDYAEVDISPALINEIIETGLEIEAQEIAERQLAAAD